MIPRKKASDYLYRFRVLASRHSFTLIYMWAGVMLAGLGMLHYKQKTGAKVQCKSPPDTLVRNSPHFATSAPIRLSTVTSEDMQPNPEVSRKIVNWIEKLGLDQVRRYRLLFVPKP